MGRTQLQDAVPMTLGQEFAAYAVTLGEDSDRWPRPRRCCGEINLGGTAIGTGHQRRTREYRARAVRYLRELTGIRLTAVPEPGRGHPGRRRVRLASPACSSGSP